MDCPTARRQGGGAAAWQYLCPFRRCWVDLDAEEEAQVQAAYRGGHTEVQYQLHGAHFTADFKAMTRTNLASKRSMELRRKDGQLGSGGGSWGSGAPPRAAGAAAGDGDAAVVVPDGLVAPATGRPVPAEVRRAWGQGIPEGFTLAGTFSFTLQLEERDMLGELLSWHMLSAGVDPQALDASALVFTDRRGVAAAGSRQAVQGMLDRDNTYPVRVAYAPRKVYQGMSPEQMVRYEVQRTHLLAVKDAVREMGADLRNVKHKHQRKTFERYLLYLEDHKYQTDDDLQDAMPLPELLRKYPHLAPEFALTSKTLGNLPRVLRGEVDILEYLFGS